MSDDYSPEEAVRLFPSMRFKTDPSPPGQDPVSRTIPSLKLHPDRVYAIMNLDQSKLPAIESDLHEEENPFLHHRFHHREHLSDFSPAKIFQMDRNSSDFFFPKEKCWSIFDPSTDQYLVPTLLVVFGLISLVGNAFVFVSFVSSRRLRTGQNLMLLNVSFADVIYVFSLVPVTLMSFAADGGFPSLRVQPSTCRSAHYVMFVTVYVTMYTLVLACFFRFSCLSCRKRDSSKGHPRSLTLCNAGILCLVVWVAFVLLHVRLLIQSPAQDGNPTHFHWKYFLCHLDDVTSWSGAPGDAKEAQSNEEMKNLWIIFLVCAFVIPMLVISSFAGMVLGRRGRADLTSSMSSTNHGGGGGTVSRSIYQARHHPHNHPHNHHHHHHQYETVQNTENDARRKRELGVVVVATAILRFVCWLPVICLALVTAFHPSNAGKADDCREGSSLRRAELFGVCMTIAGTCCTAFVYCGLVEDFKQWAWSCIGGKMRRRRRMGGGGGSKHPRVGVDAGTVVLGNKAALTLSGVKMVEMNDTIMSIITDSSNHINYAG